MKVRQYLVCFALFVVSFSFSACGFVTCAEKPGEEGCMPAKEVPHLEKLNQSLEAFRTMQKEVSHYHYVVKKSSGWARSSSKTTIEVNDKKVVSRKYEYRSERNQGEIFTDSYVETGKDIGTNKQGAAAKTMEEAYQECRDLVLTRPTETHDIFFKLDKKGYLQACFFQRKGCVDECSVGVQISEIVFYKK